MQSDDPAPISFGNRYNPDYVQARRVIVAAQEEAACGGRFTNYWPYGSGGAGAYIAA